jgi:hypothetical protein
MPRTVERPNRYFTFLRRLRADGRSNMYGAIPYLATAFGIDRNESFRIICEWIDSQEHAVPDAPQRRIAARAERTEEPTLFDPIAAASTSSRPGRSAADAKKRKPVKQRASAPKARAGAAKKPRRPSGSRAA